MIKDMGTQQKTTGRFIALLLLCGGALGALTGCSLPSATTEQPPAESQIALPTTAAIAAAPEINTSQTEQTPSPNIAEEITIDPALPPTWTPEAADLDGHTFVDGDATRPPTRTPTAVPTFPTKTSTPTQTPTLDLSTPTRYTVQIPTLPPTDELGPSKLGIHVIQNNDPAIMEFIRNAQPAVVKGVGDLGFLTEVKEVSPATITIGRVDDIFAQNYTGDPVAEAQKYVNEHIDTYLANPGVDYWEGWNEPDPNINNMPWYARFEAERVRLLAGYGLKAAIGGFPTGVPELEEFRFFLPAIEAAKEYSGILTLHEYGAPDLTYLYGSALPGQLPNANRGVLKFRYRWFYEEVLIPADLVIPLAITEAGVDGIITDRPGPRGKGWRDFGSYWVQQGWGNTADEAFINQLAWYDAGVRRDGYVIGFTIFSAGASGIPQWESYDINSILPELTTYVNGQR